MVLGLIPDCDPANVDVAPATPPAPARAIALLAARRAREIAEVARQVDKIETAIEPRFQAHFVGAMGFPHSTDPYATARPT